jgi:ATP-dependent Clp protease ATP-binding subunit ClpA
VLSADFGRRPFKVVLNYEVEHALADAILSGKVKDGDIVRVDEGDGQLVIEPAGEVREAAE